MNKVLLIFLATWILAALFMNLLSECSIIGKRALCTLGMDPLTVSVGVVITPLPIYQSNK